MKNDNNIPAKLTIWKVFPPILLALLGSGIFGAFISSIYSDRIAKREITAEVIQIVSERLFQNTPNSANPENSASVEYSSNLLSKKNRVFLTRKLTRFIETNYEDINFENLLPALLALETRHSYARIYETADIAKIVCENLYSRNEETVMISDQKSRCNSVNSRFLDDIEIKVSDINVDDQRFEVEIKNDHGNYLCNQKSRNSTDCTYTVDLSDRLENLPFNYMIINEYMGYVDQKKKKDPIAVFSIVKKITEEDNDRSYWNYNFDYALDKDTDNNCEDFFDNNPSTIAKPTPPPLNIFDRAIIRACGPLGGKVTSGEFKQLIHDNFDQVIRAIKRPPNDWVNMTKIDIINELHRIWTIHEGFNHIFCGDWDRGSIGGLHDRSRYLQLQLEGVACYSDSPLEDILPGYVYTVGAESSDRNFIHDIKGYSYNKSSLELFTFATQVFYDFCNNRMDWEPEGKGAFKSKLFAKNYFIKTEEKGKTITYHIMCQTKDTKNDLSYGIKTIYPDLTPNYGYQIQTYID